MQSSHSYATPYGNHTEQTVFFNLVQMHIKIMDTINYVPQQQAQFLNSVGVTPPLLPEHTIIPAPQPPTLTQLLPHLPPLCPTPAPQPIPFEEYNPDTTSYSLPQNNKRKKYTPTKVDDYHHESNLKQV